MTTTPDAGDYERPDPDNEAARPPFGVTRDDVVALIAELEAVEGLGAYARHRLTSARETLGRYDARPRHWTPEHYQLALRDAANAARLGLRYAHA